MQHTKCKACGAAIVFVRTAGGRFMPCDDVTICYKPDPNGKETAVTLDGIVVRCEYTTVKYNIGYRPHWATCTAPDKFRRRQ